MIDRPRLTAYLIIASLALTQLYAQDSKTTTKPAKVFKNVQAAGGCVVQTRGRHIRLIHPEVVHDPSQRMMPWPVRLILRLIDVTDFLVLEPATGAL